MKRAALGAISLSLIPVLGYAQFPPYDMAVGTWMMHHGATSLRGVQLLKGAVTGPYVKCYASFGIAEGDPIVADINADGSNEIVIASADHRGVYAFRGTDCSTLWSRYIGSGYGSFSVAVGELDPTRTGLEVAVATDADNRLYILSGTDGSIIWNSGTLADIAWNPVTIADVDGDGVGEIFVSSAYTTYAFRRIGGTFTTLWTYPAGYTVGNGVAIGDLDNDGNLEAVFVGYNSSTGWRVRVLRATDGSLVWDYSIPNSGRVALGDLDSDGHLEVVVNYHGGGVRALRHNGTLYWSRTISPCTYDLSGEWMNSPTIANLDGAGGKEVVMNCFWELTTYALRGTDGSTIWTYSNATTSSQNSSRKIGDIDNDGELEVVLTSYHNGYGSCGSSCLYHLIVLNGATGAVEWTWNNPVGYGFEGLAIADVDNDGCMEIVVGPNSSSGSTRLYVLDSPTPVSGCGVLGYDDPVNVEERSLGGVYLLVSVVEGGVKVETGNRAYVEIYATDGRRVKGVNVEGSAFIEIGKGVYVFRVKGHNLYKTVVVR